ncbi:MAG: hypothetical protein KY476_07745 [Planctomycetes bacterium]|nr:hypothetical protein [Planctomycetota bacterium]
MGLVVGIDEAGYGPNLGPLVVAATVWEVPGPPRETDFWREFSSIAARKLRDGDPRLHVGDSKVVYNPARGLGPLERSVLASLGLVGEPPSAFRPLWRALCGEDAWLNSREPWFRDGDIELPKAGGNGEYLHAAERWRKRCRRRGIHLKAVVADIVLAERFNRLTCEAGSKGWALSLITLGLLRRVWDPCDPRPTLVLADKHGGRNFYGELLDEFADGQLVFRRDERRDRSDYRVGRTDISFQMRGERHFPVALASMAAKYMRELAMTLFNRYWLEQVPGLRPTAGYPTDSGRFKRDIAHAQERLGITDEVLWRAR